MDQFVLHKKNTSCVYIFIFISIQIPKFYYLENKFMVCSAEATQWRNLNKRKNIAILRKPRASNTK